MYFDRNISENKDGKNVRAIICHVYQTVNFILGKLSSSKRECQKLWGCKCDLSFMTVVINLDVSNFEF